MARGFFLGRAMDIRLELEHPDFSRVFSDGVMRRIVARVAEESAGAMKDWYAQLPEDWFDNPEPFPDGTSRRLKPRRFMRALVRHWYHETDGRGFELFFKSPREDAQPWGLRLQQFGGVIKPKKARALTIPVTAEARGVRAPQFERATGRRLFLLKGEQRRPDEVGSLVYEDEAGRVHAAYVLRRQSKVQPLIKRRGHNAMPDVWELRGMVLPRFADAIAMALNDSK